jgi:ribonuclease BN (tRNA processing enzyme)
MLHPFKIMFDAGLTCDTNIEQLFLTHHHADHTINLPLICSRHKCPTTIYCPSSCKPLILKYFSTLHELWTRDSVNEYVPLSTEDEICKHQGITIIPTNPGNKFEIPNKNLIVEVLKGYHGDVQSNGYGFSIRTKKLNPSFANASSEEIRQMKSEGVDVNIQSMDGLFAFFCDSSILNLKNHEEWKKYPCVVVECTGLYKDCLKNKTAQEHTSLSELRPIMQENKDKRWILIHVSMKVSLEEIEEIRQMLREEDGLDVQIFGGCNEKF